MSESGQGEPRPHASADDQTPEPWHRPKSIDRFLHCLLDQVSPVGLEQGMFSTNHSRGG